MQTIRHCFLFAALFLLLFTKNINAQNPTNLQQQLQNFHPTQEECGTDQLHQRLLNNDPVYKQNFETAERQIENYILHNPPAPGRLPILTVPIVVHVMHLGEPVGTGTNISYEQILSGIQSLNDAYRGRAPYTSSGVDMEIEFCLASRDPSGNPTTGVNRINASGTSDYATNGLTTSGTNNEVAIKALSKWSNTSYYNIWTVSEIDGNNGGSGTQGFAYFPGAGSSVDGTIILHNSLGFDPTGSRCLNVKSYTNYNITFIHELGHAFNLYHTFEGDVNGTICPPNATCATQGDRCCDVPPHNRTSGCPAAGNNLCGTPWSGHMHNFMDYSSDICQTEFTNDQKTRARAALSGPRSGLLASAGCNPPATPISDFTTECSSGSASGCTGTVVQFYDLSSRGATSWAWTFPGGTPASSTAQNPSVTYAAPGTYSVTLVASNGAGAGTTETKAGYVTIYSTPTAACVNGITNPGNFGHSISNVTFNNINNTTPTTTNGYDNFSCSATTCVTEGQTYTLSINVQAGHPTQTATYRVYIDYNDDGLLPVGEEVATGVIAANSGTVTRTHNITIPTTAVESDLLRMRVIHDQNGVTNSCETMFTGSSEDYGVYISPAAVITTQPIAQSTCAGGNATFSIVATNGLTFQWQEDNGGGFANISNGGIYSGATTASLTLTGVGAPMNGYDYRCIIGNGCDQSLNSSSVNLTVTGGLSFTTQPTNQSGCAGNTRSFTVAATGATGYQWQEDNGGGFVNVSNGGIYGGATTATLTLTGITAPMNGYLYRCVASNGSCNGTSNNATLTVTTSPSISVQPTAQSGCVGDNETFAVTASSGPYQWQEDNGGGFANISNGGIYGGATTNSLTLTGVTAPMNGYTYRCVIGSVGCTVNSNTVALTVTSPPNITVQPIAQSGCVGDNETFAVTASSGPYQWQEDNGGGFANISNGGIYGGATTNSLTLTGVTAPMNGYTYRCVIGSAGCTVNSNTVALTVTSPPNITVQPTAQSGCVGDNETFAVTASSGPYQWQEDNGGGFANISNGGVYGGATTNSLTLTGVTAPMNGYTYRCVIGSAGCTVNSNTVALTVTSPPNITVQPTAQSGCVGDNETFAVTASSGPYQWQEDNGGGFANISNGGVYGGATTNSLTLTGVTAPMNGYTYRCVIGSAGCTVNSNTVALTVTSPPNITVQPTAQSGCVGDNETFAVTASSGPYQWQEDNGGGFANISNGGIYSGATTNSLTLTGVTALMNGYTYRCVIGSVGCTINSNGPTLTVTSPPNITVQPTAQSGCVGDNETFAVTASSGPYQWQEDNGGGFANISNGGIYSGATTNSLTLTGVTAPMNGYTYRCVIGSAGCTVNSNTVALTVTSPPNITVQPIAQSGCVGDNETFAVTASSGPYQWQEDNGGGFANISNGGIYGGATTNSLTLTGITAPMNGYTYRCVIGSVGCTVNSNIVALTVTSPPSITTQPTNVSDCVGNTVNFSIVTSGGTFQWQEDSGSGFADVVDGGVYSGAATNTLTLTGITVPMSGNIYRCIATNGTCFTNSNNATLTVGAALGITTQPSNQNGCVGSTENFTINSPSATTHQWQEDSGSGFGNIVDGGIYSGSSTATLTLTGITAPMNGYTYRCLVSDGTCNNTSSVVSLTIGTTPTITTQPTAQTGCVGDNETFDVTASAGPYQWQEDNGGGFTNVVDGGIYSGAGTASLTLTGVTAPMNGYLYQCVVGNTGCDVTSNNEALTVNTVPTITTQPTAQTGCVGDNETFDVIASAGPYQWQEDNGGGFTNVVDGGIYSGAGTASLTLTGVTAPMNGYLYQCVVGNTGCDVTSNNEALTVNTVPTITTQPTAQTGCVGDNETFDVIASAGPYQWQEDNGGGFTNVVDGGIYSGAGTASLTLTGVTAPMNGYLYQCVVGNTGCDVTSNNEALTVNTVPTITTQPTAQTGCVGDNETFDVIASAGPYQWQEDNGGGFTNVVDGGIYSGAGTALLTLTGVTAPMNGYLYQCVVGNTGCDVTSNNEALTVNTVPIITTQPTAQTGCVGDNETFDVTASAGPYQWQEDNGGGFTNVVDGGIYSGAGTASLTLTGVTAPMNGYLYQCVVGNTGCAITSNNEALTVNALPVITTQPTNTSACETANANFNITAPTAITHQWQEDNGGGFVNVVDGGIYSGATTAILDLTGVTASMNGYLYRCIVNDGTCDNTSNAATFTVDGLFTTDLAATTTECNNNDFSLTVSLTGATAYQWYEFDGVTLSMLVDGGIYSGATTNTLSFTNPTGIDTYQYYCDATSACGTVASNTTTLLLIQTTREPIHQADIAGDTSLFISTSINEFCGTSWEVNTGSGWTTLVPNVAIYPKGVIGDTLAVIVNASRDAYWYRRVACGPTCSVASDSAQLSIILFSSVRGRMYDFDGVDDYIAVDTTPLGSSNAQDISYTYEAWVYTDDVTTRQSILGNHNYAGTSGTGVDIMGGQVNFFKQEGVDIVSGAVNVSEWYHVAATYDEASDEMRLYVNGVLVGTAVSTEVDGGGIHNIGTHSGDAAVPLSDFFNGKMDEVRIWNVVRTQTEIREAMHRSLDGSETGLMLYYQFDRDKGAGRTYGVRDALGKSHSTAQLAASSYVPSEVHVGGGVSNSQTIVGTGNVIFTGTNLEIDFPIVHPNGEVVVTHVITQNAYAPPANAPFETGYWVVNNFGSVNAGLVSTPLFRYADGSVTTNFVGDFTLYKRPSREFGAWPETFSPAATADNTVGNNHCSFIGVNDFSVLVPVNNLLLLGNSFLRFDATATSNNEVLLSWEIDNELNNKEFEIERSADGIGWEKIGLVASLNSPITYTFLDRNPIIGQNYYRLKKIDKNGLVDYSSTRVVEFFKEQGVFVYPNPNGGIFQIDFQNEGKEYQVEVFDAVGRRVLSKVLFSNKNTFNISNQAAGMYTVQVTIGNKIYHTKIIVRQ